MNPQLKTPHDAWPWWLTLLLSPLVVAYALTLVAASLGVLLAGLWTKK